MLRYGQMEVLVRDVPSAGMLFVHHAIQSVAR